MRVLPVCPAFPLRCSGRALAGRMDEVRRWVVANRHPRKRSRRCRAADPPLPPAGPDASVARTSSQVREHPRPISDTIQLKQSVHPAEVTESATERIACKHQRAPGGKPPPVRPPGCVRIISSEVGRCRLAQSSSGVCPQARRRGQRRLAVASGVECRGPGHRRRAACGWGSDALDPNPGQESRYCPVGRG